jgi:class 3 adenylate cyclase/Tfp pilus assembly protein PilF
MKKFMPLVFLFFSASVFCQSNTDSLKAVLQSQPDDTNKVKTLYQLSETASSDSGILYYAEQSLKLASQLNFQSGIADALNNIAYVYSNRGEVNKALELYERSLKIQQQLNNQKGIAIAYNNLGYIYSNIGDINKALSYHKQSLVIREKIGDTKGLAYSNNEIGHVFLSQGDNDKALIYFEKSLQYSKQSGNQREVSFALNNIGYIYTIKGELDSALVFYQTSLKISEDLNLKSGIAYSLNNIGTIKEKQGNDTTALSCFKQSLALEEELGDKGKIASALNQLGLFYLQKQKYAEAEKYTKQALSYANELGYPMSIRDFSLTLSKIYVGQKKYKEAYELYEVYKIMSDSINNEVTQQATLRYKMQSEFDSKQAELKTEQIKKDAAQKTELERQKLMRNAFIVGCFALLIFSIVIFFQRNKTIKEKRRSEELLLNILPTETAHEIMETGTAKAKRFEEVTVLFTDFKNFTLLSERLSPEELVEEIHHCYSRFDEIISKYNIEKIKTIGDSYMCAAGLPISRSTQTHDAVMAAIEIRDFMLQEQFARAAKGKMFFEIRIGLNTGPVIAGIVGTKKFAYDIWGSTVNIAARMEHSCEPGKINISGNTYEKIKDQFDCTHRGKIPAKNAGEIDMYYVERKG